MKSSLSGMHKVCVVISGKLMRFGFVICSSLSITAALAGSAYAAEPFEGVWAETKAECLDEEGPNSRTIIDLKNEVEGKLSPLFDQYEHHCKILKVGAENKTTKLQLRCFEFWENFEKDVDGSSEEVVLTQEQNQTLKIEGKTFVRCKK